MDNIIHHFYTSIDDHNDDPIMLYIGIGTFAGLMSIDENGNNYLENKNYHQFPPSLQHIYKTNPDVHIYIILIDPSQEDPIYMSTDINLSNTLHLDDWVHTNFDNVEIYQNNRITVYPFRHAIRTHGNYYDIEHFDITESLDIMINICIERQITMFYHDFSGIGTQVNLYSYFSDKIKNNGEHIVFGFGAGFLNECYIDLTSEGCQLANKRAYTTRTLIKIFDIRDVINKYQRFRKDIQLKYFISSIIEIYGDQYVPIILSQIENMKYKIIQDFKDGIICLLRAFYTYNKQIIEKTDEIDNDSSIINRFISYIPFEYKHDVYNLVETKDINMFEKFKIIIANIYRSYFSLLLENTIYNRYTSEEIINFITSNKDKYNWYTEFNKIFI